MLSRGKDVRSIGARHIGASALSSVATVGVLMLCASGLLAGCSATPGSPAALTPASGSWVSPDSLPRESADGLHLPIEQYLMTGSETEDLNGADQMLVSRCMATFGFQFAYPPQPALSAQDPDPANMARRYGVADPSIVDAYGYHIAPMAAPTSENMIEDLSDAEYEVFWGHAKDSDTDQVSTTTSGHKIPDGGCTGEAGRQLNPGALNAQQPLAEQIDDESLAQSQTDPTVVKALTAWSQCMAKSGYTVTTPLAVMGQFTGPLPASGAEITEAKTDLACKTQTNLISTWVGVETTIQNQMIDQNQTLLSQGLQNTAALLKAAAAIAG